MCCLIGLYILKLMINVVTWWLTHHGINISVCNKGFFFSLWPYVHERMSHQFRVHRMRPHYLTTDPHQSAYTHRWKLSDPGKHIMTDDSMRMTSESQTKYTDMQWKQSVCTEFQTRTSTCCRFQVMWLTCVWWADPPGPRRTLCWEEHFHDHEQSYAQPDKGKGRLWKHSD